MTPIKRSHIKKCNGKKLSLFMIALMILLAGLCVILQLTSSVGKLVDTCNKNICNFGDPSLPYDISCVNDTDCFAWKHPCEINKCNIEGTLQCTYLGLGDFECTCKEGYKSRWCDLTEDVKEVGPCDFCNENGGSCIRSNTSSNYTCNCFENWMGKHCQQKKVVDVAETACALPPGNTSVFLHNFNDDALTLYEIARTASPSGHIDACTTFNFQNSGCTLYANVSSIAMNNIKGDRQGREIKSIVMDVCESGVTVKEQPFLMTPGENQEGVRASIYETEINGMSLTVVHMCEVTPMFGKQEFMSVLSIHNNGTINGKTLQSISHNLSLPLTYAIQGHDFCD